MLVTDHTIIQNGMEKEDAMRDGEWGLEKLLLEWGKSDHHHLQG